MPLLQCLAKVFPPLPYRKVPYTNYLIKSKAANDFMTAANKSIKHFVYDFLITSSVAYSSDYATDSYENTPQITQRREFTQNFIDSAEEESITEFSNIYNQDSERSLLTHRSFDLTLSRLSERGFLTYGTKNIPTGNGVFVGFSVCSEIMFLYWIAKVCLYHEINFDDGLCAIQDFLSLSTYENDEKVKESFVVKGKFVKSMLLIASERNELGLELLREIFPALQKLNKNKKFETASKYLSIKF